MTRQVFRRCARGAGPVRFSIMKRLLGLVTLLIACSSGTEDRSSGPSETGGDAGEQPVVHAGASGSSAGALARAGTAGEGGGAASAGGASTAAGSPAALAGEGGESGEGGEAGAGGASGSSGSTHQAGSQAAGSGGAAGNGGSGGGPVVPDACEGIPHWSPSARWTDYTKGDQRVFGGVLWHCQAPSVCTAYPGHSSSPGWFKDAECKGGPTNEVAACQCLSGQCCDGCYVRPRSYFCGEFVRTAQCLGPALNQCGGAQETIDKDYWNLFCDGAETATCSRWGAHTKYTSGDCPSQTGCVEQGDQASCSVCN